MSHYSLDTQSRCTMMQSKEGILTLGNFIATIDRQFVYHDGSKTTTVLSISGVMSGPEGEEVKLPPVEIPATEFGSMAWINERWGMAPVIFPHASCERHLRTAIQTFSRPETEHIYTHTGWEQVDGCRCYLTSTGGITAKGKNTGLTVRLPKELQLYDLPTPRRDRQDFISSLQLTALNPSVMTPMLLAAYRAAIGPADFCVHLAGRTGTYKSEITSLIQSHYGAQMDARHLPASWNSTSNALEHLAYRAANAIMAVDDFVPNGTNWQVKSLQKTADNIIRAQGNQAGRSRLTDAIAMQQTYYPRGVLLSTGEDIPEGHSVRARMLILELAPGDVAAEALTIAQQARERYPYAMADWISYLAENDVSGPHKASAANLRDKHLGTGHNRTPTTMAELIATAEAMALFGTARKYLSPEEASRMLVKCENAIVAAGLKQVEYLAVADPVAAAMQALAALLGNAACHAKTRNGGIPANPTVWGWTESQVPGNLPTYKSNGPRIGWIDAKNGLFYLDPSAYPILRKNSGGRLQLSAQTFLKRLKDAGKLARVDDARQRNTVRVTLEGHPRNVIALNANEIMEDDAA